MVARTNAEARLGRDLERSKSSCCRLDNGMCRYRSTFATATKRCLPSTAPWHQVGCGHDVMRSVRSVEYSSRGFRRTRTATRLMGRIASSRSENNVIVGPVPFQTRNPTEARQPGGTTKTKLHILGIPALVFVMLAPDARAQRRGGGCGAVSGGVRGAMVGGLVGGSEGAETGAKVGAVAGATQAAVDREAQRRAGYQTRGWSARLLHARISIQHLHRCWPPPHRLRRQPHRLRRQRPAEKPSFARMVSP